MTSIDDPQIELSKRSGGRSCPDYFHRDATSPPESLLASTPGFFGTEDLSTDRYFSPEWYRREMEQLWPKVWQVACHEQEISAVGDHYVYEIGPRSFLVVRVAPNEIKAFHNACLHRGTKLKSCAGNSSNFRCPFHGWTWELDGKFKDLPAKWDFPQVDPEKFGLMEVRLDRWGGFVFLCQDPEAPSLADWLDPLPEHFARMPYEDRQVVAHARRIVPANWKVAQEAFIESYHVTTTHPQVSMNTNDQDSQYDVLSDNVSRMITLVGVPGPSTGYTLDDQDVLDTMAEAGLMANPDGTPLKVGASGSAREVLTTVAKGIWSEMAGIDTSDLTAFDLIDGIEYSVFPNFVPWSGVGIPLAYTFTPYGNDPELSAFDIWVLWPRPEGTAAQPAPPLKVLADDEPWGAVPELAWVGPVLDQDMANMARIQAGIKALPKGLTMSAYQESRIRHHHHRLETFLAAPQ